MRILFLSKRYPQQRDLIARPYGRFHHLPAGLAALGHPVAVATCSHRRLPSLEIVRDDIEWSGDDVIHLGPQRFLQALVRRAVAFSPDWVVGCSDAWFGPLARYLASRCGARLAIDAYDNFEAYMPWNLPLHWAWRSAVAKADLITAAGPQLAARLDRYRNGKHPTEIIPMAADPMFVPREADACRTAMGLPADALLVGYAGGWASNRGTDVLLEAFRLVRAQQPLARLVLTGRPPAHALAEPGTLALGYLPDTQLPLALSALDVACVITADTSFGRYSYPAKLCEAMACGVPVVATSTAPVRWMLGDDERHLAPVGDARAIADRLLSHLNGQRVRYRALPTWEQSALCFNTALVAAGKGERV